MFQEIPEIIRGVTGYFKRFQKRSRSFQEISMGSLVGFRVFQGVSGSQIRPMDISESFGGVP